MSGRALAPWQEREVMERVLKAWRRVPHLRFGEFIDNAVGPIQHCVGDFDLATACESWVDEYGQEAKP